LWCPVYSGQPASIEEHICDVLGVMARQWANRSNSTPIRDPWTLAADAHSTAVPAQASKLRSLETGRHSIAGLDEYVLGPLSSPAHFSVWEATSDNRIPHGFTARYGRLATTYWPLLRIYALAGIMNRAFCQASIEIGVPAWQGLGRVWFGLLQGETGAVLNGAKYPSDLGATAGFAEFVRLSLKETRVVMGGRAETILFNAWRDVGAC
jgi:hypothetical protein